MGKMLRQLVLLGILAVSCLASGQRLPRFGDITPEAALPAAMITPVSPCAKAVEPFDVDDYDGPLNQLVARFSRRVEEGTVRVPRRRLSLQPCALNASGKFHLFLTETLDPFNFAGAAWDAATAQRINEDPSYGQGATGYGKRYSAAITDSVAGDFFGIFLYPALFRQDPRYYRLGQGSVKMRLAHSLEHRFVAHTDSGKRMFNFPEWLGTSSAKALSNLYHPGNPRGFGPTATRVGFSVGNDMAWDLVREFWPEIAHKFKLPFRTHEEYARNQPASRAVDGMASSVAASPAPDPSAELR
jgi:hypothetical protein